MKRDVLTILLVALLAGGLGMAAALWYQRAQLPAVGIVPPGVEVVESGAAVPELAWTGIDGQRHRLADYRGRPLLINYWASWCAPCIEEMPLLDAFALEQGADGVQVLGVALDEPDAVAAFLEGTPVGYAIAVEPPGMADSSVRLGNLRGVLPYSVLIDAEGRLARHKLGTFDAGSLRRFAGVD